MDTTIIKAIGTNIHALRKSHGMTQGELAVRLGVTPQAVSKWERGQCAPDIAFFPSLATLFGVAIDTLFSYCKNQL